MSNNRSSHIPTLFVAATLVAGVLIFVMMGAGAPLSSVLKQDNTRAWIPIVALDAYPSDEYYSMEVSGTLIHAKSIPSSEAQAGEILPRWERKRFAVLATVAGLSLFLDDIRYAILSSLVLTSVAFFLVPILGFWFLTGNPLSGLLPALLFCLWPSLWSVLSNIDPWLSGGRLIDWGYAAGHRTSEILNYAANLRKPEYVSQAFRFPFPSVGFLHVSLFYFLLIFVYKNRNIFIALLSIIFSYVVFYSYQPSFIVGCFLILSIFVLSIIDKNYKASAIYFLIGVTIIICIFVSDYRTSMIGDLKSHSVVAYLIGEVDGKASFELSFRDILEVLFNRYSISGVFCAAVVWRHPVLRPFVLGVLLACLLIKASSVLEILPNTYGRRLERRGIDPLWMMAIGISVWFGWQRLLAVLRGGSLYQGTRVAGVVTIAGLYVFPATSFWSYASNQDVIGQYSIPTEQWEMVHWVGNNVAEEDVVVAKDWLDVHYIRIFSGKRTSFATIMNTGKSPEEELGHYIASLKSLGFSRGYVVKQFRESLPSYDEYRRDYLKYREEPGLNYHPMVFKGDEELFNTAWLYGGIMRPAWFPEAMGIAKVDGNSGRVSEAFLELVAEIYDKSQSIVDITSSPDYAYFVLRASAIAETRNGRWQTCPLVYKNRLYRIFRCRF